LYGLKAKDWSVDTCKAVLRDAIARGPLRIPPALIDAEERMNKEYHVKREQHEKAIEEEKRRITETDQKFRAATTDEDRAKIDVKRFLQEKFGSEDVAFFIIRDLQYDEWVGIPAMVAQLGLFCVRIDDWRQPGDTVIVATTNDIAFREKNRIVQERKEETAAQDEEKWNTLNKKPLELKLAEGDDESPAGQWALHMPDFYHHNRWTHSDGECNIYLAEYNPADEYAYAKFKFVNFKGYFEINLVKDMQGVELKGDWEGRVAVDDGTSSGDCDFETRNIVATTFTSASECRGYIDGWFGDWEFKGVKVSHEADVMAEKCKMKFERDKKEWDKLRACHFDTSDSEKWYQSGNEEDDEKCSEEDESMDEVSG
jgi:hypothetical protein